MGKGRGSQTTTSQVVLPQWLDDAARRSLQIADEVAGRPYTPYPGQRVAGLNNDQLWTQQGVRDLQGSSAPGINTAQVMAARAGNYTPSQVAAGNFLQGNVNAYMNPYTNAVIDSSLSRLNDQTQLGVNNINANAQRAGAFGGSRHGVAEGIARSEGARAAGDLSANLYNQSFNTARDTMMQDQNRALQGDMSNQAAGLSAANLQNQAAANYGNLVNTGSQLRGRELALLDASGQQQQAYSQQGLDDQYNRWNEEWNYPIQGLNTRLAAVGATPYGQTTTQTAPRSGGNPLGTALGGAAAGAGIASALGLSGGWAGGAAGLGALLAFSEDDEKVDKKKLGKDPETGLTMYAYRYRDDPKTYPKTVGPMASEIEKIAPEDVRRIGGKRVVKASWLTGGK